VSNLPSEDPQTSDAPYGVEISQPASDALKDSYSQLLAKPALLSLISARPGPTLEPVLLAMMAMILATESALFRPDVKNPATLDVPNGTGLLTAARLALNTGFSMPSLSVFPFRINVLLGTDKVPAPNATRDTLSVEDNVLNQPSKESLTLDVLDGIGTIESAFSAPKIGSATLKESVYQFLTNVPPGTTVELA